MRVSIMMLGILFAVFAFAAVANALTRATATAACNGYTQSK